MGSWVKPNILFEMLRMCVSSPRFQTVCKSITYESAPLSSNADTGQVRHLPSRVRPQPGSRVTGSDQHKILYDCLRTVSAARMRGISFQDRTSTRVYPRKYSIRCRLHTSICLSVWSSNYWAVPSSKRLGLPVLDYRHSLHRYVL